MDTLRTIYRPATWKTRWYYGHKLQHILFRMCVGSSSFQRSPCRLPAAQGVTPLCTLLLFLSCA